MTRDSRSRTPTAWIKASRSGSANDCVEMRRDGERVLVRDSKHPHGPMLTFGPEHFSAWISAARHGEFPLPLDHT